MFILNVLRFPFSSMIVVCFCFCCCCFLLSFHSILLICQAPPLAEEYPASVPLRHQCADVTVLFLVLASLCRNVTA